ncbi:acyltransferase [Metarhizium brunneum]
MTEYLLSRLHNGAARARSFLSPPLDRFDQSDELSQGLLSNSDDYGPGEHQTRRKSCIKIAHSVSFLSVFALLRLLVVAITPSFISNIYYASKPRQLHKTSFLDGLRGYASFIVAVFHLLGIQPNNEWIEETWGVNEQEGMGSNLLQLPFIRVLFLGVPMVTCFFLISGFVLSYRSVLLIRSGEHERLSESLVSLIFRRGFRLFLPTIAVIIFEKILVPCIYRSPPPVWTMMSDVYAQTSAAMYCWGWDNHNVSLLHLWTIPIEFCCSMLLFLVSIGVSRLRTWMRLFVVGVLIIHSNASGHWAVFLFMAGLFIAETEAFIEQRKRSQKGSKSVGEGMQWISRLQSAFWITIFLVGLYLAGYPIHRVESSFDFRWVYPHTPKVYLDTEGFYLPLKFWTSVSSVLVIVALFRVPTLQKAFTTPVAQYLGDVSYSVYLVHNAIQISIGADIKAKVHSWFGADNSQWKRAAILVLDIVFIMGIVIWVADIFWRFVDKPIVRFTRYLDKLCRKPGIEVTLVT